MQNKLLRSTIKGIGDGTTSELFGSLVLNNLETAMLLSKWTAAVGLTRLEVSTPMLSYQYRLKACVNIKTEQLCHIKV